MDRHPESCQGVIVSRESERNEHVVLHLVPSPARLGLRIGHQRGGPFDAASVKAGGDDKMVFGAEPPDAERLQSPRYPGEAAGRSVRAHPALLLRASFSFIRRL